VFVKKLAQNVAQTIPQNYQMHIFPWGKSSPKIGAVPVIENNLPKVCKQLALGEIWSP
jgi:hypothetical protein